MSEPNPPTWSSSVLVFSPGDLDIDVRINAATLELQTKAGHFSDERVALLFRPGTYSIDVRVGYYTQVLGLGTSSSDTTFTTEKGVYSPAMDPGKAGSLDNFWRSAENITQCNNMLWAVSQAAPLRRVNVNGDLFLHDKGEYASGGFMANIRVAGNTEMGSQQQFLSRNCEFTSQPTGGAWSFVYIGCECAPESQLRSDTNDLGISNVPETPIIAEKPYITCDSNDLFYLHIPKIQRQTVGVNSTDCGTVSFKSVYVARSEIDTSATIQAKLDLGLHLVLTPGIYYLQETICLNKNFQVVLGLGLATLVAPTHGPCIMVCDSLQDVRIAGLMLEASNTENTEGCLLQWGDENVEHSIQIAGVLSDIFCRVGGANVDKGVSVHTMIRLYSDNVIGDNVWLWRNDHGKLGPDEEALPGETYHLVTNYEYECNTGLKVYGDNVVMYCLAVEHTLKDLVVWEGENGFTYFYQSELPYHVNQSEYGDQDIVGYRVGANVKKHTAVGLGVYSFFRDSVVHVKSAISTPVSVDLSNVYTRHLNGHGGVLSVWNNQGDAVTSTSVRKLAYI
jgi:hypothetical protein